MSAGSPLRVLALLEAVSISGTAKAVLEMAYEAKADVLGERRIEISIANFARGDDSPGNALTRAIHTAQIPFSLIREKGRFDGSVLPQIQLLVRKCDAQVIWTNSVKSHFLVHKAGVKRQCRWVAFHHGYTSTDLKMRVYNELDRLSLRKADKVLTVCLPFAEQMRARGVASSRIQVQHMPVRPFAVAAEDNGRLRNELGLPPEASIILSVGRLSHEKGHSRLIQSFAALQKQTGNERLRLVLVGDGPERRSLETQAAESEARDHILFAGHRDDANRFYGMATVFALPSFTEGTPNVLLEAMAAGVPVVATRVGGIPELAVDGKSALLTPPKNSIAFADALERILATPALRETLVREGRRVAAAHSPRSYYENMREIFFATAAHTD